MDRDPGDQRRASLRASDADRERFVEALRQHHADGRLTTDLPRRLRAPGPERAAAKANLLRALLWYGLLSVVLIVIWAMSGRDYFWPVWPIPGFMLFLGWQVFSVWYGPARFDDDQPRRRPG